MCNSTFDIGAVNPSFERSLILNWKIPVGSFRKLLWLRYDFCTWKFQLILLNKIIASNAYTLFALHPLAVLGQNIRFNFNVLFAEREFNSCVFFSVFVTNDSVSTCAKNDRMSVGACVSIQFSHFLSLLNQQVRRAFNHNRMPLVELDVFFSREFPTCTTSFRSQNIAQYPNKRYWQNEPAKEGV